MRIFNAFFLAFFICFANLVYAEPIPSEENLRLYIQASLEATQKEIARLEEYTSNKSYRARIDRINNVIVADKKTKREMIKKEADSLRIAKANLRDLKTGIQVVPPIINLNSDLIKLGDIGKLEPFYYVSTGRIRQMDNSIVVDQVIDENNMLVKGRTYLDGHVQQETNLIWIKGKNTNGLINNMQIDDSFFNDMYMVTGTTQYVVDVGSTNTVFVIEPISKEKLDDLVKRLKD